MGGFNVVDRRKRRLSSEIQVKNSGISSAPVLLLFIYNYYYYYFSHGSLDTNKLKLLQLGSYLFSLLTEEKISGLIVCIIMCVRVFESILTWGRHLVVRPD